MTAKRENVSFISENKLGDLCGSLTDGDSSATGKKKGLILIHEWWGMYFFVFSQSQFYDNLYGGQ